jgi:Flp pilus assembly pilin Flp
MVRTGIATIVRQRGRLWAAARGESGQGLVEYTFILMLVALICAAAVGALGSAISSSPGFSMP